MIDIRVHFAADAAATAAGVGGAIAAAADGTISVPISALVSGAVVLAGAIWALAIVLVKGASHIAILTEKVARLEQAREVDNARAIEEGKDLAELRGRLDADRND